MTNNNNQQAFFALLRAGLWAEPERQVSVASPVDWDEIYRLASEQSVLGLVLAGIDCLPNDQRPPKVELLQWIGEIQMLEQQNKEMNAFIVELIEKMRIAGIYTLLVKGQGVAQCYERPLWRSCGDVDFFLSEDNYQKAKDYLIPLANKVDPEGEYSKHLGMTIDPWVVELHGSLRCGLSGRVDKVLDEIRDDIIYGGNVRFWMNGNTQVFIPGVDNDIIYVFTHILNHFYKGGIGLRQICDWCRLLWTYRDSLNYGLLEQRIKSAGLMSEWRCFATLAVEYLGMPVDTMPFYSNSLKWKKKADRIMEFILKSGNMGHNRDMSHYSKYPYLVRKCVSMDRRIGDLYNHARIFPVDSLKFFPRIMFNGVRSAMRGE